MKKKSPYKPWSSEEGFRLLVETLKDYAVFMLDSQGNITTWNQGAEKILGWKENEILGKSFSVLFTKEDRKHRAPEAELETAKTKGKASDRRFHLRKDGSSFPVSGVLTAMKDEFGRTCGFAKIMQPLSERKKDEML